SGACDGLGGRDSLLAALPAAVEQVKQGQAKPAIEVAPEPAPGPRLRYARRAWEFDNLGTGFTDAHEMDELRHALGTGSGWSGRLTTSARIGPEQVGQS